jgi:cytochrome c biogenesis protein CcdA
MSPTIGDAISAVTSERLPARARLSFPKAEFRRFVRRPVVTTETPAAAPEKQSVLKRGRGFLIALSIAVGVAAVAAWIALGVGLYLDVSRQTRLILVVVAAVATEALFWSIAATLGLSVLEARKRIWRKITGRGRAEA